MIQIKFSKKVKLLSTSVKQTISSKWNLEVIWDKPFKIFFNKNLTDHDL